MSNCSKTYGNWLTRRLNFGWQGARRPQDLARWLGHRFGAHSPLDLALPWLSWPSIEYLRKRLRPGDHVFEWGGGGSTLFFLKLGCAVTAVEDDERWKQAIENRSRAHVESKALKVLLRPVPPADAQSIHNYIAPVRDGVWDVVLVDGAERVPRMECASASRDFVKPGGLLVLDDAYRPEYASAATVLVGWHRIEFWGLGPGRHGVTKTDVYIAPSA